MRSRASYDGHPIHPMLIPFPFAFITGAFVFDAAAWLCGWPQGWITGGHLAAAGVLTALIAAVPGFVDYRFTVPPQSSGRRRAFRHMLLNLSAVGLVAAAWLLRDAIGAGPVVAAEGLGTVLLMIGGYMGGTLVNRNQIGVDHRYAGSGKWKEETIDVRPGTPLKAAERDELEVNQMKLLHAGSRRIVLARTEKGYVAFDDRCPHRGGSLAGGAIMCGIVQCPWHGSQFDVRSGAVTRGPAEKEIATYSVEATAGGIMIVL